MAVLTESYIRIILGIVIAIIMLYIVFRFRERKNSDEDSIDLMDERYEKGEIAKEDHDEVKKKRKGL